MDLTRRSSGIQLHITSLPGARLGPDAYHFVDWLAAAGQTWWQVLPLAPPGRNNSPYAASSAFAGSPALLHAPRARVRASELIEFREREAYWIEDWIAFAGDEALADQVRFEREWSELREYAAERQIQLLGDIAIYVAPKSADHRAHPELFRDDLQAGVPPDLFSELGQLWGNPIYDWSAMRRDRYRWWVARLQRALDMFDAVRLDHFRGFVAYWAVPKSATDARFGKWRPGPRQRLFTALTEVLGADLPLLAEDLGVITPAVDRLRADLGLPGMVVLQFAFDPNDRDSPHAFVNHGRDRFVYTGTHDHDTAQGWYLGLDEPTRAEFHRVCAEAGVSSPEPWWAMIELALASRAAVSMMQVQDILGLNSSARMNNPAIQTGNWRWRMSRNALTAGLAARLRERTLAAGRDART